MYNATINVDAQEIIIEDRDGNVVAVRPLPVSVTPNPGRDALMSKNANWEAWERVCDLVEAANGN